MNWPSIIVCAVVLWFALGAPVGAGDASDPPPRSGQDIFESCRLCHSTKEMQRGPILDGLPAWYVTSQLKKFKQGVRGINRENRSEALMAAAMSQLRDEAEIERVAEFIASLPPPGHLRTVRGDAERGKALYLNCLPCHGDNGQGNPELKSPPLNVQEDWYLLEQLRKIKNGQRGYGPGDLEAKAMQQAIAPIDVQEFRNLIRYIAQGLARTNGLPSAIPEEKSK